jgi:hypothetical protein
MRKKKREHVREQVRSEVARHWPEAPHVLHFPKRTVEYCVPGRTKKGDLPGIRRVRSFVRQAGVVLRYVAMLPVTILVMALDSGSTEVFSGKSNRGSVSVRGDSGCSACHFADLLGAAGKNLWIVWSGSRLAMLEADERRSPSFLWQAAPEQRPYFGNKTPEKNSPRVSWEWDDGSTATLLFSFAESDRMRELTGVDR